MQDPHAGYMMFPKESNVEVMSVGLEQKTIDKAVNAFKKMMKRNIGFITPILICCVDYRFSFESAHHQTRKAFTLGIPVPGQPGIWKDVNPAGTVNDAV